MTRQPAGADTRPPPYPPATAAWWAFSLFVIAVLLAFIDRQVLSILVEPVRRDLDLSDTQIGLLQGPAFAVFYALAAVPLGMLVDRTNRRNLIIAGLLAWSSMTALCGLATDFWSLFAFRVGVGIGEACLIPAIFSLVGDYFPPERRRAAFGIYIAVVLTGSSLAVAAGGLGYAALDQGQAQLFGLDETWRQTFVLVAMPGPLVALFYLTLREPVRQECATADAGGRLRAVRNHLLANKATFFWAVLVIALAGMIISTVLAWFPAILVREHGLAPGGAGLAFGAATGVASIIAALAATFIPGRLKAEHGEPLVAIGLTAAVPALLAAMLLALAPTTTAALLVTAIIFLGALVPYALSPAFLQSIVPNEMRGTIMAGIKIIEYMFVALGSLLVGIISDALTGNRLTEALTIVLAPAVLLMAYALFRTRRLLGTTRLGTEIGASPKPPT